jgi:single stranded DNA-binding protein
MAKSVNKVILVGNVGQDPEVKYTASGVPAAKLSLATNERFKDKNGAWQDRTEWGSGSIEPLPRMAQRCGLAALGGDRGRVRAQRLEAPH